MAPAPMREAAVSAPSDERIADVIELLGPATDGDVNTAQRFGEDYVWLLGRGSRRWVLKRGRPEQDEDDVSWEHDHLRRLSATGFPASAPVPAFDGQSWTRLDDRIWATLSYLPGRSLASEPVHDMEAAGAFLARYHGAARLVPVERQRPTSAELSHLREVTPPDPLREVLVSDESLDQFARLLDDLEGGLRQLQYETLERLVIHGDPTNDNLIVEGAPPAVVGMIDFGSAHLAPWIVDLAAALWRSGRRVDSAVELDLARVTGFVAGYHGESPLPLHLARAIPLLIQGRGLQLIGRRVRRLSSTPERSTLAQVALTLRRAAWVHKHREPLSDSIERRLSSGSDRTGRS
jgi:Ser/Thr protein kinase RdoA (MazF antagonist)